MTEKSSMKMRKKLSSFSNAGGHGRAKDVVVDETTCEDGVCDTWDAYKSVEFVSYCVPHLKGVEVEDDAVEESNNPVRWPAFFLEEISFS